MSCMFGFKNSEQNSDFQLLFPPSKILGRTFPRDFFDSREEGRSGIEAGHFTKGLQRKLKVIRGFFKHISQVIHPLLVDQFIEVNAIFLVDEGR